MVQLDDDGFEMPDDWKIREYITIEDIVEYASGMNVPDFNTYINLPPIQAKKFKNDVIKKNLQDIKARIQKGEVIRTWTMS